MKFLGNVILSTLLLATSLLPVVSSAKEKVSGHFTETEKAEIHSIIVTGTKLGWSDEEFNKALKKFGMNKEKTQAINKNDVYIESTRGDVYMPAPSVYTYDSGTKKMVVGQMTWRSDAYGKPYWFDDKYADGAMGGEDAIGIYLSNAARDNIRVFDSYFQSEDRCGGTYDFGGSAYTRNQISDAGAVHKAQDTKIWKYGSGCQYLYNGYDYNWDSAWAYIYMEKRDPSVSVDFDVRTSFSHTWETTYINSISLGYDSIGFGYSNAAYGWDKPSDYATRISW